jgi:hypothetical protein
MALNRNAYPSRQVGRPSFWERPGHALPDQRNPAAGKLHFSPIQSGKESIIEHIAGVDDFEVAVATYWAAVARWPAARITLRQGIRVVHGRRVLS